MKYDVFLSHCRHDKNVVRDLASRLRSDGLKVWFDEWEIRPGEHIGAAIDRGLAESRVLVLAMSRHAYGSEWMELESGTFRFRDPVNKARRFIPLRIDEAEVPLTLRPFAYIDWRVRSESEYARLLFACRKTEAQEARIPITKPQRLTAAELDDHDFISAMAHFRSGRFVAALAGFRSVVRRYPDSSEARYYLILCALAGKRPKLLPRERVAEIDEQLQVALAAAPGDTTHIRSLWALIRYDCYTLNGLREPAPTVAELLENAHSVERERAAEMTAAIVAEGNAIWERLKRS